MFVSILVHFGTYFDTFWLIWYINLINYNIYTFIPSSLQLYHSVTFLATFLIMAKQSTLPNLTPAVLYFDLGFVVGMPGGGVYEQRVVSHLQNITIMSPESGSAPSY
jgi:hypothetical protein